MRCLPNQPRDPARTRFGLACIAISALAVTALALAEGTSWAGTEPPVLDIDTSDKAARFIRFCNAFNIPIVEFRGIPACEMPLYVAYI